MLWRLAGLKSLCRILGIRGINVRQGILRVTFGEKAQVKPEAVLELLAQHKRTMSFKNGKESQLIYRMTHERLSPLEWLEKTLPKLAGENAIIYCHATKNF